MAYPVAVVEYSPSAGTKKVYPVASNGLAEDTTNPNYVAFRFNCLTSRSIGGTVYQLCSYWNDSLKLVLGVRNDGGGGNISTASWTFYTYNGTGGLADIEKSELDAHNMIAHEIDSDGIIHLAYDHHNVALNYRRSTVSVASFTGALTAEASMLGTNESSVAYPTFVVDPTGVLHFFFRDGISGAGDLYFYTYNTGTTSWAAGFGTTAGLLIEGTTGSPDQSPYWAKPQFSDNWDGAGTGYLNVAWHWRETSTATTSHDVSFMRGNGTSWTKIGGSAQTIPATLANCDIIDAVPQSRDLTDFDGLAIDSSGHPHLCYTFSTTAFSIATVNIYHNRWNGSAWVRTAVNFNYYDASLGDTDTQKIVIDGDDQAYIFARVPWAGTGLFCFRSRGTDYTKWDLIQVTDEDLLLSTRYWTGTFHDEYQWKTHGKWMTLVPLTGVSGGATTSFPESWPNAVKATISNPSSAITDAIFLIDAADLPAAFWSGVESDLSDVAFSIDGEVRTSGYFLPDTNYAGETGTILGRYSGVLPSSGTNEVWIHWGNAAATFPAVNSLYGREGCFRTGYRIVSVAGGGTDATALDLDFTLTGTPTEGDADSPIGTAAGTDFDGSQYGLFTNTTYIPSTLGSAGVSIWGFMYVRNLTANLAFGSISANSSGVSYIRAAVEGTGTDGFGARQAAASASSVSLTSAVSQDAWMHVAAVFASDSSRTAYVNGTAATAETTTRASTSMVRVGLGTTAFSTPTNNLDGKIFLWQLSREVVSAAEIAWQSSQSNQATFWGTWEDANPATSGEQLGPVFSTVFSPVNPPQILVGG